MKLEDLVSDIKSEFPDFKIVKKSGNSLMKVIDVFLKIVTFGSMNTFMNSFITTIGNTVYVPDDWDEFKESSSMGILRHERIHMRQAKRYTRVLFSFLYLFVPLPMFFAWFRAKFEMEAYEETMKAVAEYDGIERLADPKFKEFIVQQFIGSSYAWMLPSRKTVERWYEKTAERIKQ